MQKPLRDLRVLDLTNVLAGPFCCHQLAHMGAEVIKVEAPGTGDLARQLGADAELNQRLMGVSFLAQNSGKQSITINLKHVRGKEVFRKLVRSADVLVENFRPGVMDRLGLGYETLKQDNQRLIYCAISGFGQDGPLAELPAYDQIIQGMSGVMSITGDPQTAPYRVGYPVSDTIGGLTAAFAVAASLADHQRTEGYFIDVSMLEATLATMGWVVSNHLIAGKDPVPMGNENMTASPSGTFRTGDGLLNIAANKQEQFEAVCRVVGKPELATDERFAQRQARLANRAALTAALEAELTSKPATDWWPLLNDAGVPAGPVLSVPDTLAHPQVRDRGMIGDFANAPGVGRDIRVVRTGFKLNRQAPAVDTPPPELGQHTREILGDLGYSDADINQLSEERAI
ncbi:CoA-transferase; caiB/baiF CoA-transferase family (plasmid) [Cupriavidus necator N-1]|uniref:CoA-transferase caiB/baiF CoA-transferase family n=1 Tax=Cupriavidus necator (strain ATCC 43291 / DSM 13513 / CCUG 52238 / LMG 8453 / N-1) TaxID=1042878 RepID=F8GX98_CUPNN|nr:CaiB/BaiF CoA-transferase family protein [Cupriavidus necator]AEI81968.1 CoA-transferase; caiB/baiF CoA-transferase family [Cupriavidus necator N-1]MDX6008287.1 CaiB/BaiF CoA-transferase family protein [Cupriavidus necator]